MFLNSQLVKFVTGVRRDGDPKNRLDMLLSALATSVTAFHPSSRVHFAAVHRAPVLANAAVQPFPQRLLELIEPTDRGVAASDELREEINAMIEALEATWSGTDAFSDAQRGLLLRRTEVAYVGQTKSVTANAAGGRYRGRWGRMLFRTEALFQHVLADAVAVNVIQFRLLGLLRGCAVLSGEWRRPTAVELEALRATALEKTGRALSDNTISVAFSAPRIAFGQGGGLLNIRIGPSSEVALDTTYLDDTLRICRGIAHHPTSASASPTLGVADTRVPTPPCASAAAPTPRLRP